MASEIFGLLFLIAAEILVSFAAFSNVGLPRRAAPPLRAFVFLRCGIVATPVIHCQAVSESHEMRLDRRAKSREVLLPHADDSDGHIHHDT